MKIINSELLFKHMDQHNWNNMNREQIEGFVQELDTSKLNEYSKGYLDALEDAIWVLTEKRTKILKIVKMCCSCRWWANTEEVCCCEGSDRCNHFTRKTESCQHWEKDKML